MSELPCGRRRCPARGCVLLVLLGCALPAALGAQAGPSAGVSGRVLDAAGKPVPYATLWLVPADTSRRSQATLSDGAGGFGFEQVVPGRYYLRVDRRGFRPEWSDARELAAGQRLKLAVTSAPAPVVVPRIDAPGRCLTGEELARDSAALALWLEARKAATARRLFDRSYRYEVEVKEQLRIPEYLYRASRSAKHRLSSTPALARALQAGGGTAGYGVGMDSTRLVAIQEMLELLAPGRPSAHCLMTLPDDHGRRRIHLRPLNDTATHLVTAANIVLDRDYRLRRIEFEYRLRDLSRARGYAEFGDGGLKGGDLPFLRRLQAWVSLAALAPAERLGRGPRWSQRYGVERATASVKYRNFQRDTAS